MRTDWIPSSIDKLATLSRFWNTLLTDETIHAKFRWNADLCEEASGKIKSFIDACDVCLESDSTYNCTKRRETRAAAVKAIRAFAASSIRNNPYMTEPDRKAMGLRKPDTVHTPHNRPESRPTTVAERTMNYYEHRVKAIDTETGRNAKPADAYGVRFVWQLDGERPANATTILKGSFSRRPAMTFTYEETDRGKTAYYACCYENKKGEAGPWSPVVEAYIG